MTDDYNPGSNRMDWDIASGDSDPNTEALDQYAKGWEKGDSSIIYQVLDMSYIFTSRVQKGPGIPNYYRVTRDGFKQFLVDLRKAVAEKGGPAIESDDFMKFTNVIRRKVI